jgi:hypothetical protein
VIPELFSGTLLYLREREAGSFLPVSYFWAVVIGRFLFAVANHVVFSLILYFMIGFYPGAGIYSSLVVRSSKSAYMCETGAFFMFFVLTLLTTFVGISYGHALAATCPTAAVALGLYPPTFAFLSAFAGL